MTVATTVRKSDTYTTNGATTEFAYPFVIASEGELKVYRTEISTGTEVLLSLVADYTVTGVGNASGGNVVISPALASGYEIVIVGQEDYTQETDFANQGPFHPETHEAAFDKLTKLAIDLKEKFERSIRLGEADDSATELPGPTGVPAVLKRLANGDFSLVPVDEPIIQALGDAPEDGNQYARKDGDWYEVELGIDAVSVKDYGAVGNGSTNDSAAIQSAIDDCISTGKTLLFPSGTYMLTSAGLTATAGYTWTPGRTLKMVGIGEVTLKTTASTSWVDLFADPQEAAPLLRFTGAWDRPLVKNIKFVDETPYTYVPGAVGVRQEYYKQAIGFTGGSSNLIKGAIIEGCTFDGFSRSVGTSGVDDFTVRRCRFFASTGRDGGSQAGGGPNVGLWGFNNANGNTRRVQIVDNRFDGYTGANGIATDAPITNKSSDGFVYGTFDGGSISRNLISNFGYEAIFVAAWPSSAGSQVGGPLKIENNVLDGTLTTGSANDASWGIRCGMDNAVIQGNVVTQIKTGILISTNDTTTTASNIKVLNNYVDHRVGDAGIGDSIQASGAAASDRIVDCIIADNVIVHDFTGMTSPSVGRCNNLGSAKALRTHIVGNFCHNTGWVDDVTNTLDGVRVYATEDCIVERNVFLGAQHLISRQGIPAEHTSVLLRGNTWEISDDVDDPSISRNDSDFWITGGDTAYPIHATTAGNQTQKGDIGSVIFSIGQNTLVVTNSLVTADSVILANIAFVDATATAISSVVPGAGSFTIKLNAAATAETKVNWKLFV